MSMQLSFPPLQHRWTSGGHFRTDFRAKRAKLPSVAVHARCHGSGHWGPGPPLQPSSDKPVFESSPPTASTTMYDVRDAMEACSNLVGAEADACFLVYGLDCQQTKKWFPVVDRLETQLQIPFHDLDHDGGSSCRATLWGMSLPQSLDELAALWHSATEAFFRRHCNY